MKPQADHAAANFLRPTTLSSSSDAVQDVHGVGDDGFTHVEGDGMGSNPLWPARGVDLHGPALVAASFGTRTWMARRQDRITPRSATALE